MLSNYQSEKNNKVMRERKVPNIGKYLKMVNRPGSGNNTNKMCEDVSD